VTGLHGFSLHWPADPSSLKPLKAFSPMRVAFVQNFWAELAGPLILAEILEQNGHEVRFFLEERGFLKKIGGFAPDVLALSVCTGQHHWYLDFAQRAKAGLAKKPLVVMGGPHPTHFPEIIRHPAVDAICRGEGEIAFPKFLAGIKGGMPPSDIENFYVKLGGKIYENPMGKVVRNLDSLPVPSRTQLYDSYPFLRDSPYKKIMASRGCPFSCHYCSNHALRALMKGRGPYLRTRSPENVVAELAMLKERYPLYFVDIIDDIFTLRKSWVLSFAKLYKKEVGRPYGVNIHARFFDDELAGALKDSGCTSVAFGVECGDEPTRRELLGKDVTNAELSRCADILRRHDIRFRTFNMLGLPGKDLAFALDTLYFNMEIRSDFILSALAFPLPGTRFAAICAEKTGLSEEDAVNRMKKSWFDSFVIPGPDAEKIQNLHKFLGIAGKHPWLLPVIRLAVLLPPNALFRAVSQAFYGFQMKKRTHTGWLRLIRTYFLVRRQY